MGTEERVSRQIQDYKELADKNKGINAAALMINALAQAERDEIDARKRKRAYLVSVILPPFGLIYAAYYYFGDKPDGKSVAINCVILTLVSFLVAWGIGALMFACMTPDQTTQIQNVNADQVKQMLQEYGAN